MAKQLKKLRHPAEVGDHLDGEDGDFVQLRLEREKRRKNSETHVEQPKKRGNSIIPTLEKGMAVLKKPKKVETDGQLKLQKKLFKCIDDKNLEKFTAKRSKHGSGIEPEAIRDLKTNMNILHYALEIDSMEIASSLIEEGNIKLITSTYKIQRFGLESSKNIIHILTEKGNNDLIVAVLNKIVDADQEKELINMETVVEMDGQRPKLLPCFHLAAFLGNTALVDLFLDRNELDIDCLNSKHETALMWATRGGHLDTVRALMKQGADVSVANGKGSTALYWAVRYSHVDVAKVLITEGNAETQLTRKHGLISPLILACAYGNVEMVELLLSQRSVDVNLCIRGREMALHYAVREGHSDIVKMLIEKGAIIDNPDEFGDSPLLLTVQYGHVELASMFINEGANIDRRNREGHDVWHYAIDRDDEDMLEALVVATQEMLDLGRQPLCVAANLGKADKIDVLIRMDVDISATDREGNSFLHHAAMKDNHEIIRKYCSADLVNLQNKKGNTAFHLACFGGFEDSIKALIDQKAKPGVKNNKGETVLHSAAYCKTISAETVNKLVEYVTKNFSWDILNSKDFLGNNCLHIAAKHATPEVIWQFRKVSIKEQDKDGMTPLHEAVRPNEPEALDIMLDIFELARRDARINEQTFVTRETVLNFAANEGHTEGVERLIQLGADISERDYNGDTVLHRIVSACMQDGQNKMQHLEVFDVVLENAVTWWCIKNNLSIPYESDTETLLRFKEEAMHTIIHTLRNKRGMSVCDFAFASGCPEILSRLLMMPDVTYFVNETEETFTHIFDITGLMPRTKPTSMSTKPIQKSVKAKETEVSFTTDTNKKRKIMSGIEWLITCKESLNTDEILDIPPVQIIEGHFMSLVGWIFTMMLLLHIAYMSVFTYVGIEIQQKLRDSNFTDVFANITRSDSVVLYFLVPLEPVIIIVLMLFAFVKFCITGDFKRRIQLGRNKKLSAVLAIIQAYALYLIYITFAILVITWIILLRAGYSYQDYILAFAICMGWLICISFTRGIKVVHYFYKMLISIILRDVVRFLLVYMFVLLAISLAMHVLFQISDDVIQQYSSMGATAFMTFNLMTGMGDLFDDTLDGGMRAAGRNTDYIKAFYLLYIILGTVIMLNVLIAMMNDSYSNILREKSTGWRIDSIKLGIELERTLPLCRLFSPVSVKYGYLGYRMVKRWYVTLNNDDIEEYFRLLERKANQPDALTRRLDAIEQRTLAIEKLMTQKFKQITDTLETKKKKKAWYKRLNFLKKETPNNEPEIDDDKGSRSPTDSKSIV